jgi:hypothetical protein
MLQLLDHSSFWSEDISPDFSLTEEGKTPLIFAEGKRNSHSSFPLKRSRPLLK